MEPGLVVWQARLLVRDIQAGPGVGPGLQHTVWTVVGDLVPEGLACPGEEGRPGHIPVPGDGQPGRSYKPRA